MTLSYSLLIIISVFPGPPSICLVTRYSDSLTIQIQLSDIGTAPIFTVEMNITLGYGELLDPVLVNTLQPSTNYTIRAVAVNQLGPGSLSMEFIFTEGMKMLFQVKHDD